MSPTEAGAKGHPRATGILAAIEKGACMRSQPIKSGKRKPTAIVSGDCAERAANGVIRYTSIIVLVTSFVGTIVAINGRWPNTWQFWTAGFWSQVSLLALVGGCAIQGLCTLFEWGFRRRRLDPRYFVPFLIDMAATYVGFGIILVGPFTTAFTRTNLAAPIPAILAHLGVLLLSAFAAYYPEQNLVDD